MIKTKLTLDNLYAFRFHKDSDILSKEAFLFLHGFPATNNKNEDIAEMVSFKTGSDSLLIHYSGLGAASEYTFDFVKSIEESINLVKLLQTQYKKIHLIGHSWGGLIALNIFTKYLNAEQRGQLILLAPFTEFPHDGSVESWLIPMAEKQDLLRFTQTTPEEVKNNFFSVEKLYPPRVALEKLKIEDNQIALIEAINDPDVPNASTESLYRELSGNKKIQRVKLNDDHCFANNRSLIIESVLDAINNYTT